MKSKILSISFSKLLSFGNNASSDSGGIDEIGRMDDFTLLGILDWLDFDDLISVASINPRFQYLITKHYLIPEFHLDENRFAILLRNNYENDAINVHLIDYQHPPLHGSEVFRMLRITGHIFKSLSICNRTSLENSDELTMVWQYVNKYCTQSLEEIDVFDTDDSEMLNEWKLPFENCKHIKFINSKFDTDTHFNHLFPQLQELVIDYSNKFVSLESLNHQFPYLQNVSLKIPHHSENRRIIEQFIGLNPQILNIHLPSFGDFSFIKYLDAKLSNLESLSLTGQWRDLTGSEESDNVLFKNVKKFTWSFDEQQIELIHENDTRHNLIEFDQLETFEISLAYTELTNETLDAVIEKYNGVKVISLRACFMTYEQLERTVHSVANLEEIILEWNISITRNRLQELIEFNENTNLKKITICSPMQSYVSIDVKAAFPTQWTLNNTYRTDRMECLSFLRPF